MCTYTSIYIYAYSRAPRALRRQALAPNPEPNLGPKTQFGPAFSPNLGPKTQLGPEKQVCFSDVWPKLGPGILGPSWDPTFANPTSPQTLMPSLVPQAERGPTWPKMPSWAHTRVGPESVGAQARYSAYSGYSRYSGNSGYSEYAGHSSQLGSIQLLNWFVAKLGPLIVGLRLGPKHLAAHVEAEIQTWV